VVGGTRTNHRGTGGGSHRLSTATATDAGQTWYDHQQHHSRNPGPDVNLHERVATLEANVARLMEDCDG
jgi:hypothetical protein